MLGFAPFNRPVANLFLGDVGSLPIGLLLGWLLLELAGAAIRRRRSSFRSTISPTRRSRCCALAQRRAVLAGAPHAFLSARDRRRLHRFEIVGRVFLVNLALVALALVSARIANRIARVCRARSRRPRSSAGCSGPSRAANAENAASRLAAEIGHRIPQHAIDHRPILARQALLERRERHALHRSTG